MKGQLQEVFGTTMEAADFDLNQPGTKTIPAIKS